MFSNVRKLFCIILSAALMLAFVIGKLRKKAYRRSRTLSPDVSAFSEKSFFTGNAGERVVCRSCGREVPASSKYCLHCWESIR